jgi:hypothetical protein
MRWVKRLASKYSSSRLRTDCSAMRLNTISNTSRMMNWNSGADGSALSSIFMRPTVTKTCEAKANAKPAMP